MLLNIRQGSPALLQTRVDLTWVSSPLMEAFEVGSCCPYIKPAALSAQVHATGCAVCQQPCGCHCCHRVTSTQMAPSAVLGETPSLGRGGTALRNICFAKPPGRENKQPTPPFSKGRSSFWRVACLKIMLYPAQLPDRSLWLWKFFFFLISIREPHTQLQELVSSSASRVFVGVCRVFLAPRWSFNNQHRQQAVYWAVPGEGMKHTLCSHGFPLKITKKCI